MCSVVVAKTFPWSLVDIFMISNILAKCLGLQLKGMFVVVAKWIRSSYGAKHG